MGGGVGRAPLPDPSSPLSLVAPQITLLPTLPSVVRARVAAAALCLLSPSLSTRVLLLAPEQPPLPPLPRRPKPRVAPVVSLCHYALQSRYACRYTIALCARTLPVHRQVRHLPFPWSAPFHLVVSFNFCPLSAWPLRVGWRRRPLLLWSFSACARTAASLRTLPSLASRRCPRPCRVRLRRMIAKAL